MKKFFYACLGILCLALTFHFGATSAQGQGTLGVRCIGSFMSNPVFVTSNGVWVLWASNGWMPYSATALPPLVVSEDQIVTLTDNYLVTTSGEGYMVRAGQWQSLGYIPGGPTQVRQQSWGQLKTQYR